MNCDCIEKVNEKLAAAGYEYKVDVSLVFDSEMNTDSRLAIQTYWNDPLKRGRKKPPSMLCTFCPFCGANARKPDTGASASITPGNGTSV